MIAAFTAINAVLIVSQSHTSFVPGPAFTQVAHRSLVGAALVVDALPMRWRCSTSPTVSWRCSARRRRPDWVDVPC